jgi:hypothetical protein
MPTDYENAHSKYRKLAAERSPDKAKAMSEIRQIERQAAKEGKILSAVYKGDKIETQVTETTSKKSLQEEYCRKFSDKAVVNVGGKPQTLREFHTKRLLTR